MSELPTVKVDRSLRPPRVGGPAGLLHFYPLGQPPSMRFHALSKPLDIGRSDSCAVQIEDEELSRRHALLEREGGAIRIIDCDSANGVFVNGERVSSLALQGGEVIRAGGALFRFLQEGTGQSDCTHALISDGLVGGPRLDELRGRLEKAARSDLTVLVIGETGTGKELAAQQIHSAGPRAAGPFVPVNCAAIPDEIMESELFGHVKGAFTGAAADHPGLIRRAHRGTLFLDEIGELPMAGQAKLLRVLQDRRVLPVGGKELTPVDIHVVCATNRELGAAVQAGSFRPDLFARIAGLAVRIPPLRDRIEDVPLLVQHFLAKHGAGGETVSVEALEELCLRPWPFNVRQLENAVRRALLLAGGAELRPEHFAEDEAPPVVAVEPAETPTQARAEDPEAQRLEEILQRHRGDVDAAARELGLSRSQLYRRAQKHGIRVNRYR